MKPGRVVLDLLILGAVASPLWAEDCASVEGVEVLLKPGKIVLLGEIHGTRESPLAAVHIACTALDAGLAVTVGLEIPQSENKRIQQYLDSDGTPWDQVQMLEGDFWQRDYQDGRSSTAMLDLIETFRTYRKQGRDLHILVIDNSLAPNRDQFMAQWLRTAIQADPERFYVTLTGNMHNRLEPVGEQFIPMGFRLRQLLPEAEIVALQITYAEGTAWVCTPDGCGVQKLRGQSNSLAGIQLFQASTEEGFSGNYDVGEIAASLPAKNR